ncbi:MAG: hypothetical protein IJS09_09415 [Treponema sp.]|nr:hypothetical protein [Treponema sp.]
MNIPKTAFVGICASTLLLFSCINFAELKIPETISVETRGATYSVPLGSGKADFSEHLSIVKIREQMEKNITSDDVTYAVYDYNPDNKSEVQEFLIKYDLQSIDLNMKEMLDKINLDNLLSDGLTNTIEVPKPDLQFTQNLDFDINTILKNNFNALNANALPFPEMGTTYNFGLNDSHIPSATLDISPAYTSMTLKSGEVVLTITPQATPTSGYSLKVKAYLFSDGTLVAASGEEQEIANGGTIIIPLTNKTLSNSLSISFTGTISGGTPGKIDNYSISCGLQNLDVAIIKGITLDDADDLKIPVSQTIDIGNVSNYVLSATIKEGYLNINTPLPSGWTGITTTPNIVVSGALDITNLPDGDNAATSLLDKHVDLADKAFNPTASLNVSGEVLFALNNATLDFRNGTPSLVLTCAGDITSLKDAKVDTSEIEISNPITNSLPDDVTKYVKEMKITGLVITGDIKTTLDAESLVAKISVSSNLFNMKDSEGTTISGSVDIAKENELSLETKNGWSTVINLESDPPPTMDFLCGFTLDGETDIPTGKKYVVLKTITLGETYSVEAKLHAEEPTWEYIVLKTDSTSIAQPGEKETGLNLNDLFSGLFSGDEDNEERSEMIKTLLHQIELTGIEAYAYVVRPKFNSVDGEKQDPLRNLGSFSAYIYAAGDKVAETPLLGTSSENKGELRLLEPSDDENMADYEKLADPETFLITKDVFKKEEYYSAKLSSEGICSVLNEKPNGLKIGYDIGLSGSGEICLTPEDLESLSGEMAITMSIGIRFPLMMHVGLKDEDGRRASVVISDLMTLVGTELTEDLFQREESDLDDDSYINKIAKMFESVSFSYTMENNTGLSMTARLVATNKTTNDVYLAKTLILDNKAHLIELPAGDISTICEKANYPFIPKFELTIAPTSEDAPIKIARTAYFQAKNCMAIVKTDGVYTVMGD